MARTKGKQGKNNKEHPLTTPIEAPEAGEVKAENGGGKLPRRLDLKIASQRPEREKVLEKR